MTLKNMVETVQQIFPNIGETQVVHEIDKAQKDFCRRTGILRKLFKLTDIDTKSSWELPEKVVEIDEVLPFNDEGQPCYFSMYNISWLVEDGMLRFYSYDGTTLENLSDFGNVYVRAVVIPDTISTVSDTLEIDEDFHEYLLNYVFERFYSSFPVEVLTQSGVVKTRDWQAVKYHAAKYLEGIKEGKRRKNSEGTTQWNVQIYQDAGLTDAFRPREDSAFTNAIEIS